MKYMLYILAASSCFAQPAIVFKRADGGVSVYRLKQDRGTGVDSLGLKVPSDETIPEWIERHRVRVQRNVVYTVGPVTSYHVVPVTDIPRDQTFRNAWAYDGAFTVNRARAEAIQRQQLDQRVANALRVRKVTRVQANRILESIDAMDLTTATFPTLQDLKSAAPTELTTNE